MGVSSSTLALKDQASSPRNPVAPESRMQQLIELHSAALFRFLLGLTSGEPQQAQDLLQETLLRAWRKIDELNADVATLRPWLYTVARRIAIDAARARHARPLEIVNTDIGSAPDGADHISRVLTTHVVREGLAALSPEHRAVIVEIYFRGRSTTEAAARLGIPAGTVKSRSYHALRRLRAALDEAGVTGD